MNKCPIEFDQVIHKIEDMTLDGNAYYHHKYNGTMDDWYKQLMDIAVTDILLLPIEREARNLLPIEEMEEVDAGMLEVVELLAVTFDKAVSSVRSDLIKAIEAFPVEDVRTVRRLRHEGMLN